jgi:predicted DNA-binding transcriptional regulator YafY
MEIDPDRRGISRRQILDDIVFMEGSEGWSIDLLIIRDGKRVYYRYEDTNYSINNMPLNEIEISQLQSAMQILSQFNGMPQFEWVNEMLPKLKQGISDKNTDQVISFDSNQYLKGIEYLSTLYNAISFKTVLDIAYKDFKAENAYHIIIHPYYLKQYNNRWFLFGMNEENKNTHWNLALDRIEQIETTSKKFKSNRINWEEYFEDVIGVTVPENGKVEKVLLHFGEETGKYIYNKPLHGSQRAKWIDKSTLEVTMQLIINYELERMILSYAGSVTVIAPVSLKKSIKQKLERALETYF